MALHGHAGSVAAMQACSRADSPWDPPSQERSSTWYEHPGGRLKLVLLAEILHDGHDESADDETPLLPHHTVVPPPKPRG